MTDIETIANIARLKQLGIVDNTDVESVNVPFTDEFLALMVVAARETAGKAYTFDDPRLGGPAYRQIKTDDFGRRVVAETAFLMITDGKLTPEDDADSLKDTVFKLMNYSRENSDGVFREVFGEKRKWKISPKKK